MNTIQISRWANLDPNEGLHVDSGIRPIKMCNSDGTGTPLLKLNSFGADVIRFGKNEGVTNHTHEGDHILIVIKGSGFVEYNKVDYALEPGVCYMVPGNVDHAIKATTELVMIAVGNNHQPLDSEARMVPVPLAKKS
ncbi:cupin domain-containing protein [Serratia ureilytica]|uniref:cupin domain-containing protein n=1 Tax=Serratia ureilytica TaxID=300181 RepID=UPI0018D9DDA4|nr:cupin domain-containing protein [Serratia ureilytica]MBH2760537.1 cupin domain-containing protein [Serratia ureilytica]